MPSNGRFYNQILFIESPNKYEYEGECAIGGSDTSVAVKAQTNCLCSDTAMRSYLILQSNTNTVNLKITR